MIGKKTVLIAALILSAALLGSSAMLAVALRYDVAAAGEADDTDVYVLDRWTGTTWLMLGNGRRLQLWPEGRIEPGD